LMRNGALKSALARIVKQIGTLLNRRKTPG
jgi:hypothetical protein